MSIFGLLRIGFYIINERFELLLSMPILKLFWDANLIGKV